MRRLFYLLVGVITLCLTISLSPPVVALTDLPTNVALEAASVSNVPVKVPTQIPGDRQFEAIVGSTWETEGYSISIVDADQSCQAECGIGSIKGEPVANLTGTIQSQNSTAEEIIIATTQQAFYVPPEPNFEFSSHRVIWEEGDYRYEFLLYHGTKEQVINMANSAF